MSSDQSRIHYCTEMVSNQLKVLVQEPCKTWVKGKIMCLPAQPKECQIPILLSSIKRNTPSWQLLLHQTRLWRHYICSPCLDPAKAARRILSVQKDKKKTSHESLGSLKSSGALFGCFLELMKVRDFFWFKGPPHWRPLESTRTRGGVTFSHEGCFGRPSRRARVAAPHRTGHGIAATLELGGTKILKNKNLHQWGYF